MAQLSSVIQGRKKYPVYKSHLMNVHKATHKVYLQLKLCNSNTLRCKILPTLGTLSAVLLQHFIINGVGILVTHLWHLS